jgi:hypothetical protein
MRRSTSILAALPFGLALAAASAAAQTPADSAAIRAVALDYAQGWYAGDADRMQRALHPSLAKRMVQGTGASSSLNEMGVAELVAATRRGGGRDTPGEARRADVTILDIFGKAASVRLAMDGWVDYMHLALWEGRWRIVNVLWELHPR